MLKLEFDIFDCVFPHLDETELRKMHKETKYKVVIAYKIIIIAYRMRAKNLKFEHVEGRANQN